MGNVIPSAAACHAASRLGRTINRALADSALRPPEYRLLAHLVGGGQAAAAELAEKLLVSRPSVTATVDSLSGRGLVAKSADPGDGRRIRISPTRAGTAALRAADRIVATRLAAVLDLLGEDAAEEVSRSLELLHRALDEDRAQRHARDNEVVE